MGGGRVRGGRRAAAAAWRPSWRLGGDHGDRQRLRGLATGGFRVGLQEHGGARPSSFLDRFSMLKAPARSLSARVRTILREFSDPAGTITMRFSRSRVSRRSGRCVRVRLCAGLRRRSDTCRWCRLEKPRRIYSRKIEEEEIEHLEFSAVANRKRLFLNDGMTRQRHCQCRMCFFFGSSLKKENVFCLC